MAPSRSSHFLASAALVLVLLGGALAWVLGREDRRGIDAEVVAPVPDAPAAATGEPASDAGMLPPPRVVMSSDLVAKTNVLWPLRIELELLEARYLPTEEGVPRVGSGAQARFSGRIYGPDTRGARATLRFVAGANAGRVLTTDVSGQFGASDLYPGLSIVEVSGPGLLGSRREVRLRQDQEALLNIPYARPASVQGRVQDRSGAGIEGAEVLVDGQRAFSGPDGGFALAAVAPGQVPVEITHQDYASTQELVWLTAGSEQAGDKLTFTLERGSELRVSVTNDVGGPGPALVYLLAGQPGQRVHPESAYRNARYPYYRLPPLEVSPGRPASVRGLPEEAVHVYAFRAGAAVLERVVNLRAEHDLALDFDAAPALTGRVLHGGEPVARARVSLEAPNQVRTTLDFLRQQAFFLETEALPVFPPARQVVLSDERGRFLLTSWEEFAPTRYLEARGPDGKTWVGRLVHRGETGLDLELSEVTLGDSTLTIDFLGRWQGLPVEVLVQGAPLDPWILPPTDALILKSLVAGRWRVAMTWHGDAVHEQELVVDGEAALAVPLPPECIEGQDAEAWRRAGRDYPGAN